MVMSFNVRMKLRSIRYLIITLVILLAVSFAACKAQNTNSGNNDDGQGLLPQLFLCGPDDLPDFRLKAFEEIFQKNKHKKSCRIKGLRRGCRLR